MRVLDKTDKLILVLEITVVERWSLPRIAFESSYEV